MNIIMKAGRVFDRTRTYYVAGPMSGLPDYNFPAFDQAMALLNLEGINCRSPHEIDHGEDSESRGSLPYQYYLKAGFKLLLECEGVILLHGWTQSRGVKYELQIARALQYPIFTLGEGFLMELSDEDH